MVTAPALRLRGVTCRLAGRTVLDGIDLEVRPGEVLGLIGPNGAGKTTLFNVVSGFQRPDGGGVWLAGRALDGLPPARRARLGLVRTFQAPLLFPSLSVEENLLVATERHAGVGTRWFGARRRREAARAEAAALLRLGLPRRRGSERVSALSHGERRVLDVLLALALRPRVLLLDEPTAGLAPEESGPVLDAVRHGAPGAATVLIAHDIDAVMARSDRVAVLALGRLLCCAGPDEVRRNRAVQDAYLAGAGVAP